MARPQGTGFAFHQKNNRVSRMAIKYSSRVPAYLQGQEIVGFCDFLVASFPRGKALVGGMLLCYFLRAEET